MANRYLCWLLAVGICFYGVGVSSAQADSDQKPTTSEKQDAKKPTSYVVSYRKPGATEWTEYQRYSKIEEANRIAGLIKDRGYEVEVLSRFTITKVPAIPAGQALPEEETVTPEEAVKLHRWMARQKDIAFQFPSDGCYARAHLMCQRMQARGFSIFKAWTFANGDEQLYVRTDYHPKGYVEWKYHVAPIVRVQFKDEKQRWYVIDPSLFSNPVTIPKWRDAQKKSSAVYEPFVTLTRLGQPPKDPAGTKMLGSGYWPGKDPDDLDQHALAVMRLYKPYEGRTAPASVYEEFKRLSWLLPFQRRNLPLDLDAEEDRIPFRYRRAG